MWPHRVLLSFFHTYHQLCVRPFSKEKLLQAKCNFPSCFRPSTLPVYSKFYLVCEFFIFISGRGLSLPVHASLANYLEWLQAPKNELSLLELFAERLQCHAYTQFLSFPEKYTLWQPSPPGMIVLSYNYQQFIICFCIADVQDPTF